MIGGHECFSLRRAVKFTTMAAMWAFPRRLMRRQLNAALVLVLFAVMTLLGLTLLWPFASDLSVSFRSAAHRRSTTYVRRWHSCTRTIGVSEVQAVESSRLARSVGVHP